jgi:hypothetical protein
MNFIMATLTEVSVVARKTIKWGTIGLVVMAMIPGTISLIRKIYVMMNPPPPPPPTVRYGKLPRLMFPVDPNVATPEYKLETVSGSLPALPNVAKVYLVGINRSRLLVLDRMTERANQVGLTNEPVQINDRTYRYSSPRAPIGMMFDVITGGLSYTYDWTTDKILSQTFSVPIGDLAVGEARRFLGDLGALPEDLANGEAKVIYLAASGSAMEQVVSPYEANFVRIDLFRTKKDEKIPGVAQSISMDTVTVGGDTSPVNVILSGSQGTERVVQANYYYSQVLGEDFATYPLKPVQTAWQELVAGGGFVAKRTTENKVTIRHVNLAYFESNEQQDFLQPVYVFDGDGGFLAYVQAVDESKIATSVTPK